MGAIYLNGIKYGGGGGTEVVPNPEGEATSALEKLEINGDIYSVSGGATGDYMEKEDPTGWGTLSSTANEIEHDDGYNIIWGLSSTVNALNSTILGVSHGVTTANASTLLGNGCTASVQDSTITGHGNKAVPEEHNPNTFLTDVTVEGTGNNTQLYRLHLEGYQSSALAGTAIGAYNEAEGSHIEGYQNKLLKGTTASLRGIHIEGQNNIVDAVEQGGHIEGATNKIDGTNAYINKAPHIEGFENTFTTTSAPHIYEGLHIQGANNKLDSTASTQFTNRGFHIEGYFNDISIPLGPLSSPYAGNHIEGSSNNIKSQLNVTHIEGYNTLSTAAYLNKVHIEGDSHVIKPPLEVTHIEGFASTVNGGPSTSIHVEGDSHFINAGAAKACHIEGYNNRFDGLGLYNSHVEGSDNVIVGGQNSETNEGFHVEGKGNLINFGTSSYQHVQGRYNEADATKAFIIGNGTNASNRSNAFTIDWNGNVVAAGDLTVGYQSTTYKLSDIISALISAGILS